MQKFSTVTLSTINVTINNKCTAARRALNEKKSRHHTSPGIDETISQD